VRPHASHVKDVPMMLLCILRVHHLRIDIPAWVVAAWLGPQPPVSRLPGRTLLVECTNTPECSIAAVQSKPGSLTVAQTPHANLTHLSLSHLHLQTLHLHLVNLPITDRLRSGRPSTTTTTQSKFHCSPMPLDEGRKRTSLYPAGTIPLPK
jgi:hypothetical protein